MIEAQSDTRAGVRNKALLSLGCDLFARRSELVALRTTDLEFTKDGALKGVIRKRKTDQYGRGRLIFWLRTKRKIVKGVVSKKPRTLKQSSAQSVMGSV